MYESRCVDIRFDSHMLFFRNFVYKVFKFFMSHKPGFVHVTRLLKVARCSFSNDPVQEFGFCFAICFRFQIIYWHHYL